MAGVHNRLSDRQVFRQLASEVFADDIVHKVEHLQNRQV